MFFSSIRDCFVLFYFVFRQINPQCMGRQFVIVVSEAIGSNRVDRDQVLDQKAKEGKRLAFFFPTADKYLSTCMVSSLGHSYGTGCRQLSHFAAGLWAACPPSSPAQCLGAARTPCQTPPSTSSQWQRSAQNVFFPRLGAAVSLLRRQAHLWYNGGWSLLLITPSFAFSDTTANTRRQRVQLQATRRRGH